MVRVPGFRISAVTAPSDVSLELNAMSRVICFFEAAFANNASGIFFTIETPPGYISIAELLRADPGGPNNLVNFCNLKLKIGASCFDLLLFFFLQL